MKLYTILLCLGLLLPSAIHAQIYVWTDEHGNKVYGDAPTKDHPADTIEQETLNILNFPEIDDSHLDPDDTDLPALDTQYSNFSISSPANNELVRSTTGTVQIIFTIEPNLAPGHKIQLYLDNAAYGAAKSNTSIQLDNIIQGSHSVKGVLLDENGKKLKQSPSSTFQLLR